MSIEENDGGGQESESRSLDATLRARLSRIYGPSGAAWVQHFRALVDEFTRERLHIERTPPAERWSEKDIVLISYGDQVRSDDASPLATLRRFLIDHGLDRSLNAVHVLPFFPYSSDDGFSVIDYLAVDPACGSWDDVHRLGDRFDLMFDLVLNHVSRQSEWFQRYVAGEAPYDRFFIEIEPANDLSAVTRPRSHPLLASVQTSRGERHIWTTFSDDQMDLNFAEPEVLRRMLAVLLEYVRHGARIIRLDAVAYLWKEIGTPCVHRPQTHEVVKLMRDVLDAVAVDVLLLTETNVPHDENVSYFGAGDEAHMVYQFSLPPLLIDGFLHGSATVLTDWLKGLGDPPAGTTYFNFTASHDGIGVRPLEGLVEPERIEQLVQAVRDRGGHVSTRRAPDGQSLPYELNVSYVDALADPEDRDLAAHARRFLTSQGIMLALQGIPGIYFHSLVGTENYAEGVSKTHQPRTINRRKFHLSQLDRQLDDETSLAGRIFEGYRGLLNTRAAQPAFHPDAAQVIHRIHDAVLAVQRTSRDGSQHIVSLANLSREPIDVRLTEIAHLGATHDLITDQPDAAGRRILLLPHQLVWLTNKPSGTP